VLDITQSTANSLVIMPKVVKQALQWRSKWPAQVQSYVNQTELTSELSLQCNYFNFVERRFYSKNSRRGENC